MHAKAMAQVSTCDVLATHLLLCTGAVLNRPVSLAVAPTRGLLFWLDAGSGSSGARVCRVNMDGTDARKIYDIDSDAGLGMLAVDEQTQTVYFSLPDQGDVSASM